VKRAGADRVLLSASSIPSAGDGRKLREYELSTPQYAALWASQGAGLSGAESPGGASSGPDDERDPRQLEAEARGAQAPRSTPSGRVRLTEAAVDLYGPCEEAVRVIDQRMLQGSASRAPTLCEGSRTVLKVSRILPSRTNRPAHGLSWDTGAAIDSPPDGRGAEENLEPSRAYGVLFPIRRGRHCTHHEMFGMGDRMGAAAASPD